MYHSSVVAARLTRMADVIRKEIDPAFEFREPSVAETGEMADRLADAWDPLAGGPARALTQLEEAWIRHELSRCKCDFRYWCTRYAKIKDKMMNLTLLQPTAVQDFLLQRIGDEELRALRQKGGDGILLLVLKARQLGCSTISDIILAHRVFFYANTTALVAADVDERTPNLYEMIVRCYDNLPWWLQPRSTDPKRDYRVKAKQIYFADQDSMIRFGSSANTQGGSSGEVKGSIGTGMTLPLVHCSELALWRNPYQIDDALMPSIPISPRTFAIFESTAKGRDNWWYDTWQDAKRGLGRAKPVFIPWYTDPGTYKLPAPADWEPSEDGYAHAARVEATSGRFLGKTTFLTKDQLYWWERTKAEYKSKRVLYKFLAEYCADDEEAFQNTTHGVFSTELIDSLRQKAAQPIYVDLQRKLDLRARQPQRA